MTPTTQQILELAREAGGGISCIAEPLEHPWKFKETELMRFATLLLERYGQAPAVQQEPVAYAIFAENGNIRIWATEPQHVKRIAEEKGLSLVELYTHPAPAEVREPLKNGQVEDCFKQWGNEPMDEEWESLGATDQMRRTFFEAFRLAEAAHGITGSNA